MKKFIFVMTMLLASQSHAASGEWICGLTYKGEAKGFQILLGYFKMKAKGNLHCENTDGEKVVLPVTVTAKARPFAGQIAMGFYKIYGASANINLGSHQPEDLLGNYYVAQAQGSIIGGVGVNKLKIELDQATTLN